MNSQIRIRGVDREHPGPEAGQGVQNPVGCVDKGGMGRVQLNDIETARLNRFSKSRVKAEE